MSGGSVKVEHVRLLIGRCEAHERARAIILRARIDAGLTQLEMARKCRLSQGFIAGVESGALYIAPPSAARLAARLGLGDEFMQAAAVAWMHAAKEAMRAEHAMMEKEAAIAAAKEAKG